MGRPLPLRSKEVLVRLERLESQQLQTATANAERREERWLENIIGFVVLSECSYLLDGTSDFVWKRKPHTFNTVYESFL